MACITLKRDRYYKIMAGITCFCCTTRIYFSIQQRLKSPMQQIRILVLSIYYSCFVYWQLGGGELQRQKYFKMISMLCSFKFVIPENNCCAIIVANGVVYNNITIFKQKGTNTKQNFFIDFVLL